MKTLFPKQLTRNAHNVLALKLDLIRHTIFNQNERLLNFNLNDRSKSTIVRLEVTQNC